MELIYTTRSLLFSGGKKVFSTYIQKLTLKSNVS